MHYEKKKSVERNTKRDVNKKSVKKVTGTGFRISKYSDLAAAAAVTLCICNWACDFFLTHCNLFHCVHYSVRNNEKHKHKPKQKSVEFPTA